MNRELNFVREKANTDFYSTQFTEYRNQGVFSPNMKTSINEQEKRKEYELKWVLISLQMNVLR